MQSVLLDSGADATVLPLRYAQAGTSSTAAKLQLHDAQGREIPVVAMRDVEISLLDQHGRRVTIREHGAISAQSSSTHHQLWEASAIRLGCLWR